MVCRWMRLLTEYWTTATLPHWTTKKTFSIIRQLTWTRSRHSLRLTLLLSRLKWPSSQGFVSPPGRKRKKWILWSTLPSVPPPIELNLYREKMHPNAMHNGSIYQRSSGPLWQIIQKEISSMSAWSSWWIPFHFPHEKRYNRRRPPPHKILNKRIIPSQSCQPKNLQVHLEAW